MKLIDSHRTLAPKWCKKEGEHHDWHHINHDSVFWCTNCGAIGMKLQKRYMNIQFPGNNTPYHFQYEEGEEP